MRLLTYGTYFVLRKRTTQIQGQFHDEDGHNFTGPAEIVEAFSKSFASVYTPTV